MYCNICGHMDFLDFSGRHKVLCAHCNSTERHRILVRSLLNYCVNFDCKRMLVINGHESVDDKLKNYFSGVDFSQVSIDFPISFSNVSDNLELIIHTHFLNNVNVKWDIVLSLLVNKLASSGRMFFTLPIDIKKPEQQYEFLSDYKELQYVDYGSVNQLISYDNLKKFFSKIDGRFIHLKLPERELLEISAKGVDVFLFIKH